ncbi:cyclic nucleotide-binding domain protein [Stanieria sp. NIES-3757]|nr:cyclic nucleotide-binding domain protein [Stanieria sp. NIES-3757]
MTILKAEKLLALLEVEASRYQILSNLRFQEHNPVFVLLRKFLLTKQQLIILALLAVLETLDDQPDVIQLARRTGILAKEAITLIFQAQTAQWQQRLSRVIFQELHPDFHPCGFIAVVRGKTYLTSAAIEQVLRELLHEPNPVIQAASLYALNQLNSQLAKTEAHHLLSEPLINKLVKETAFNIFNQSHGETSTLEQLLHLLRQEKYQSLTIEQLLSLASEIRQLRQDLTEIALSR